MKAEITLGKAKVLKHLAEADPELAQEIGLSDEPERKIAEEVLFAKLVKFSKYKDLDLETLLIALDFWKQIFDTCIKYLSTANMFFMMNFIDMYSYIATAVEERIKVENQAPSAKDVLVMKALELMDEMKKNMNPMSLNTISSNNNVEVMTDGKKKRKGRRKSKAKA